MISQHIEKIEEMASLLMSITDIAALLEVDECELREAINDSGTGISKAYKKGKAQTIYELRKNEVALAKIGSPMAVELAERYRIEQTNDEDV
jgi:phage antirepressor YoqD-like protein